MREHIDVNILEALKSIVMEEKATVEWEHFY